jgi:hypothetical protein
MQLFERKHVDITGYMGLEAWIYAWIYRHVPGWPTQGRTSERFLHVSWQRYTVPARFGLTARTVIISCRVVSEVAASPLAGGQSLAGGLVPLDSRWHRG